MAVPSRRWRKLAALEKYLPYYDWVLWMDGDTMVANYSVELEWFLEPSGDEEVDVVLTDHNIDINNGVMFLRNSEWSAGLLARWRELGDEKTARKMRWDWDDQGALFALIVERAHASAAAPTGYDGRCASDHWCCHDFIIADCLNEELNALGHIYRHRSIAHIRFIDPVAHVVPARFGTAPGAWVRGGFNRYVRAEMPAWVVGKWKEVCARGRGGGLHRQCLAARHRAPQESFYHPGDFVIHVYDKSRLAGYVPRSLKDSCAAIMTEGPWSPDASLNPVGLPPAAAPAPPPRRGAATPPPTPIGGRDGASPSVQLRPVGGAGGAAATLGRQGEDCTTACARALSMRCDTGQTRLLNNCEALYKANECRNGCHASTGDEQPAAVVAPGDPSEGMCLYNTHASDFNCKASHPATARLCGCAPNKK